MDDPRDNESLEHLAPTLHHLRGRDPLVTPEEFFERLPHAVQAKAVAHSPQQVPLSAWLRRIAWALPMVVVLVAAVLWWWPDATTDTATEDLADTMYWWDPLADDMLLDDLYADAPGLGIHTLELTETEWLAYWEEQDLLDLYLENEL